VEYRRSLWYVTASAMSCTIRAMSIWDYGKLAALRRRTPGIGLEEAG
jgi:hypothetical protein